jgi:hypothetical protein
MNQMTNPPGLRWVLILGAVGFAAGFFGPLIFVPEANQGPLVGIFISGPAGAALGFVLYLACRLFSVSARTQWRLLSGTAVVGAVATLIAVQPQSALRGTLYDTEVKSCMLPIASEAEVIRDWEKRIADVTWAAPRSGWQQDMHQTLADAPGILVQADVVRENRVFENRKPWNRGSIFAQGWKEKSETKTFYYSTGTCDEFPAGREFRGFQKYDLNGKIEPPKDWPPKELEQVINASTFTAVPEAFKSF